MTSSSVIEVSVDDFIRTHYNLVRLLYALQRAGPKKGMSTRVLCDQVFHGRRQGMQVISEAVEGGYVKRFKRVKTKKPLTRGRDYYIVSVLTPKGNDLLAKLQNA
jgi:hypothetical protein